MSPDIHWRVGDDAEQETIATATSPRRSRRSWIAVAIVIVLGASLGVAYRSLPEAAPRPSPTLSPTPETLPTRPAIPVALYQTIDREAQALADGDFEVYRDVHAPSEVSGLQEDFTAWGRPGDDRPLYGIVDFDLPTESQAWADIRQFREGRYFRETRFYYRASDQWLRGAGSNYSLWHLWSGQEESLQTPHFDVIYAVEDHDVLPPTLNQLEEDYQSLCRDLGCTTLGHVLTFTVRMTNDEAPYVYTLRSGNSEIRLPSPRLTGFYESGRAYDWNNNLAHFVLAQAIAERVHGTVSFEKPGGGLFWAGSIWAVEHIDPLPAKLWHELGDLTQKPLLSLETLWELGGVNEPGLALAQLNQLLRFIEQEYGAAAVTQLLGTIDSAKSLSEAIENGLGVSFAEFDQKWQTWAKQNISSP
jgi:hypothetical protein